MPEQVLTSLDDGIFTITLNNPSKHNCMGFELLYALRDHLTLAANDKSIRVILITGAGEKSFSTGANIKEFNALEGDDIDRWIIEGNEIYNQLEKLQKPTVALINGYAMGGGLELALCCDFRLATENALLSSPEMKNGWLPGWGGMTRLSRLIGVSNAKRVVLLSEHLNAQEALNLGLITKILTADKKEEALADFLNQLKALKPKIYALAKAALMDENRTTQGTDLQFDVMAVQVSRED